MGVPLTDARIPIERDYASIGCQSYTQSCDFLFRQSYWLATYNSGYMLGANTSGVTYNWDTGVDEDYAFGVRPLIVVPTSTLTN